MERRSEIDALRQRAILSSLAGFPFLLVYGLVWIIGAGLSYLVPRDIAPWVYVLLGMPATPIAIALEKRMGYVRAPEPDPLLPLTLQVLFVQVVAFPAILLVWDASPHYVPVAFAAVVGAHFLPFQWIYRTRIYGFLGVVVAAGSFALALLFVRGRCTTRVSSWVRRCWSERSPCDRTREQRGSNREKPTRRETRHERFADPSLMNGWLPGNGREIGRKARRDAGLPAGLLRHSPVESGAWPLARSVGGLPADGGGAVSRVRALRRTALKPLVGLRCTA